jgi:hypothetical protein
MPRSGWPGVRLWVLAIAVLSAGCLRGPGGDPHALGGDGEDGPDWPLEGPVRDGIPCDPSRFWEDPGDPASLAAPRWSVGDYWNYTYGFDASPLGYSISFANYSVARTIVMGETSPCVYALNHHSGEMHFDEEGRVVQVEDNGEGYEQWYDVANLWFAYEGDGGNFNPGYVSYSEPNPWDFPIWDGKEYLYDCCGDVIATYRVAIERASEDDWTFHVRAAHSGDVGTRTWSADVGFWSRYWDAPPGVEHWGDDHTLVAYRYQATS